jgi:hypothetical protein
VFIVTALGGDFNLARMERYLALVLESGATPVIVLNKADLTNDVIGPTGQIEEIDPAVPIHAISARARDGARDLEQYFQGNRTVALVGSSGVGKSTLTVAAGIRQLIASCSHDWKVARLSTAPACVVSNSGIPRKAARAISMISRLWQPNADFAIVGTTVNRGAQCALPLIGGTSRLGGLRATSSLDAHRNAAHGKSFRFSRVHPARSDVRRVPSARYLGATARSRARVGWHSQSRAGERHNNNPHASLAAVQESGIWHLA